MPVFFSKNRIYGEKEINELSDEMNSKFILRVLDLRLKLDLIEFFTQSRPMEFLSKQGITTFEMPRYDIIFDHNKNTVEVKALDFYSDLLLRKIYVEDANPNMVILRSNGRHHYEWNDDQQVLETYWAEELSIDKIKTLVYLNDKNIYTKPRPIPVIYRQRLSLLLN